MFNNLKSEQMIQVNPLKGIENKSVIFKIIMIITKEVSMFVKAVRYDGNHLRNIIYVTVSVISNQKSSQIYYAFLLIDLVNKVPALGQVLSIFDENKSALMSVLGLFFVMLYFYSFLGFLIIRDDFVNPDMDPPDEPDFNMYCDSLTKCLLSVSNFGIRAGGGIGDVLKQRWDTSEKYMTRYFYDYSFFMIINIVLMNIFFGIIIDSFADKRAGAAEIDKEVQGLCFICGISKSKFEIENIPWVDHIYGDHNMHSYLSFMIFVKQKNYSECTGVEKWVKKCLDSNNILFYPVNRCMSIGNGELIGE